MPGNCATDKRCLPAGYASLFSAMAHSKNPHQGAVAFLGQLRLSYELQFNMNKKVFATSCRREDLDDKTLNKVIDDLFTATQVSGLSDKRAPPIARRCTSLHPLSEKLIKDI